MDRTTRLGAAVATALVLGLSGCGGDPSDPPASTDPPPSSEPPESAGATAAPDPEVPPATGDLMRLPGATMKAPAGWTTTEDDLVHLWEARSPDARVSIYFSQVDASVSSLDRLIDIGALNAFEGRPRVSRDAELGGEPAFRAVGRSLLGDRIAYGAVHDGEGLDDAAGVTVEFSPHESVPQRQRRRIEQAVLATFTWE